ncbi:cell division cycle protein 20 homolog [Latimeria chalumnae]|uniref:cell division cycle protein 20 homolog n=1 Tax=Latimeria chalumnae TaxID=7897 RepID=UPI00313D7D5F
MAQFMFENDLNNILKLDTPIANAPLARWQRKANENSMSAGPQSTSMNTSGLSPLKTTNRSLSTSKTPSKTPGKSGKGQVSPSNVGADRYIPNRSAMQMDVASFLLSRENGMEEDSPTRREHRKMWALNLNGFDIEDAKILKMSGKPQNAPEGYQNNLKVLYSQKVTPGSSKKSSRYIPTVPDRILDAPALRNDFYLNLIDWSMQNLLAVALGKDVYLWNAGTGDITQLLQLQDADDYISSISWIKEGNFLAVGTSNYEVQVWDVQEQKRLRNMVSHSGRVSALSWNSYILSSGSKTGFIHHHDVRVADHHVATLAGHTQEVCGLKWSPDGRYLASGGNDNMVNVWPCTPSNNAEHSPLHTFTQHQGAIKAIAWCPWQPSVLATGGGTSDRQIRIWNIYSGSCLNALDTQSQVCALAFSSHYKEMISGHGFSHNQLVLWKYPTLVKVKELKGHTGRVLSLALSPDGNSVVSAAADETLRVWKCFELDPAKKKEKEKNVQPVGRLIHQSIR